MEGPSLPYAWIILTLWYLFMHGRLSPICCCRKLVYHLNEKIYGIYSRHKNIKLNIQAFTKLSPLNNDTMKMP